MSIIPIFGIPAVRAVTGAAHRIIFRQGDWFSDLAQGKIIDGTASRDPGNSPDTSVLRAGLLMGKETTSGLYAPSFMGFLTAAFTTGSNTSMQTSVATAVEIVRRVTLPGTLNIVGPATANGTAVVTAVTVNSVNTSTGVLTLNADPGVSKVNNSLIGANDGSQVPTLFIPDGWGIQCTDGFGNSVNVPFPQMPIAGVIESTQLLPLWPTDTGIQAYIVAQLSQTGGGKYVFDHLY